MSPENGHPALDEATLRRLAQLADDSLQGRDREELEAQVAASPTLRAALEHQRTAAAALRGLDLQAGPALRERIASGSVTARLPARRRRLGLAGALAGAVAAVALAAVLIYSPGGGNPTVVDAARLSQGTPTAPVAVDADNHKLLAADVEAVPFPNWHREFGWRQVGTRSDRLDGRTAQTVFYEHNGKRVAYTIVSGRGIPAPHGSAPRTRNGVHLHSLGDRGRRLVTWWRDGRTCVLSSADVGDHELIKLATWKGDGAVPF
jgi:hypothetical protein